MILSDSAILDAIRNGSIVIEPFDSGSLGSNSYDVHLSEHIAWYTGDVLDARRENRVHRAVIDSDGVVLEPGVLYLGSTIEYTETHHHVPFLEGKSSVGRLGISIHETAGKGDVGFCNHWTLEISTQHPVRVYAGMPIGQLIYHEVAGEVIRPYGSKASAKYQGRDPLPRESAMHKNYVVESGRWR